MDSTPHKPVLYQEIIDALRPRSPGIYVDATVGAGGHAWGILEASSPAGILLGLDVDPQALAIASQRLIAFGSRAILVRTSYTTLHQQAQQLGWDSVAGVLVDLGVSSMQLDTPQRGFSFQQPAELDMRFDPGRELKAADLVNNLPEEELAGLLWRYGEERQSRRIARAICQARPLQDTAQLAGLVARITGRRPGQIHPATRTFQALRIAVNQELQNLEEFLPQALQVLSPGGRLAVLSYHSLEDRLVKQYLRRESLDCICPPQQPVCTCGHRAILKEISRRPILPSTEEVRQNPRARSAKLRIAERLKLA